MGDVDERRGGTRKRTLRAAKIVYGDFRYTLDCVIRDRSETGARIRCANSGDAPAAFYLFETPMLLRADIAWRRGDELGIRFTGETINVLESVDPRLNRFKFLA